MGFPRTYVQSLLDPTVFERIQTAANFQEGDRVPIWDFIDNWRVLRHFAGDEKDKLVANARMYHALGIDMCRGFGESYTPGDEGRKIMEGCSERRILGLTLWNNPPVKSVEDLNDYCVELPDSEAIEKYVKSNAHYCEVFAPNTMWVPGCNVGFDIYYSVTNLRVFSVAMRKIPDQLRRIMKERNDASLEYVKAVAKERISPLFFIGEDIAYKRNLMFSPDYLKREFIPLLGRLCSPLTDAGIRVIFHSDGYLPDDLIDQMINVGVKGLNPLEPIAGMDIGHLKRKYYGKLILVGNLDCSQLLPLGTREEVIQETRRLIRIASVGGGHFIGSSSEITPTTPFENILAFYQTVHEEGKYPIR